MNINEIKKLIFEAGVVGAGGAGFPTHKKIPDKVKTIIINAAECEPLLNVDIFILNRYFKELVQTLELILNAMEAEQGIIAVKSKNIKYLENANELITKTSKIQIKQIADIYPAGDEVVLTYEVTGKVIPEGNIPLSIGVVVLNVETLFNIKKAIEGYPVFYKYLTVTGCIQQPVTLYVPIGTPFTQVLESAGVTDLSEYDVIVGGPIMGNICDPKKEYVTKTTKGIVILPSEHSVIQKKKLKVETAYKRASAACCQCRACTDMCPRYLLGYSIEIHKTIRSVVNDITMDTQPYMASQLCSACGVCDFMACTQDITPRSICSEVKNRMMQQGLKFSNGKSPEKARPEREYRMVPAQRLLERCGLAKYDKKANFVDVPMAVKTVTISLKQHIGKPAEPVVKTGDSVIAGQLIAKIEANDVGANIHASINGLVIQADDKCIVIMGGKSI